MASNGWDNFPKPEPALIALGIWITAIAIALGPKRALVMMRAARRLTDRHEARERIVAFNRRTNGRTMSRAVEGGVAWSRALIEELDDGVK